MNKEEQDYASDSDESDEDFCPDKTNNSDAPSEEESDDPISDNEDVPASKKTKTKTKKKERSKKSQVKKTNKEESVVEEEVAERVVATRNRSETTTKSSIEKNELDSDEEDSSRKEALWADFLSDIPSTTTPSRTNKPAASSSKEEKKETPIEKKKTELPPKESEKVVIKQIFEFAGEEVLVEKTVSADSIKSNGSSRAAPSPSQAHRGPIKRPAGGGLGSILGQLDKKKKISVLEKTKLDWDSFKTTEGIDEDLQTFNKGKDGYLQRQDFLERTDLRQFEIEKSLRASRRKPM